MVASMKETNLRKEICFTFSRKPLLLHPLTGCGEIGRRTRLRIWRSNPCRFDPYHPDYITLSFLRGCFVKKVYQIIYKCLRSHPPGCTKALFMASVARENIGVLNDKIVVKVSKEDYFPTFEKKLKEYSKTVNMPGFRKGMVPQGMIKKMYGPSIYTDEVLKTVEKQLYSYLDTEKPEIFAQPLA